MYKDERLTKLPVRREGGGAAGMGRREKGRADSGGIFERRMAAGRWRQDRDYNCKEGKNN